MSISAQSTADRLDIPISVLKQMDNWEDESKGFDCSLQVGDYGIFTPECSEATPEDLQHRFIRGNHDNPMLCGLHPNYLGDYGYIDGLDMFYLSGGFSVDQAWRTPYINWWPEEELNAVDMTHAFSLFAEKKPKIMVSHECPTIIKADALTNDYKIDVTSSTEIALQDMYDVHQPDIWIFGHHHSRVDKVIGKTHFIGLQAIGMGPTNDCIFEISGLVWPKVEISSPVS